MASPAVIDAFESAKKEFRLRYPPTDTKYDFSKFPTITHVYKAARDIQNQQAANKGMRNLKKIQPFLECLRHYGEVIETLVQVKPDVLALIWGPIKCILLIANTYTKTFDNMVDVMSRIGAVLPSFEKYVDMFPANTQLQHVLCLFYQDILDFYSTILDLFNHKKWTIFFESIWPRYAGKIKVVSENIATHRMLMDAQVTLSHVSDAHIARRRALDEYDKQDKFRHKQEFEAVLTSLAPSLYDEELDHFQRKCSVQCGQWLQERRDYMTWTNVSDTTTKLLWLQGIPGAGKTHLSALVVKNLARTGIVAAALPSYRNPRDSTALRILQSLVIQLVLKHIHLQTILIDAYNEHYRRLQGSVEFVKELCVSILSALQGAFIVIDGLDEMSEEERYQLLTTLLEVLEKTFGLKILISSRPEDDIVGILAGKGCTMRVQDFNSQDIKAYVDIRARQWASRIAADKSLLREIGDMMRLIAANSQGMFLYARLVCDSIVHSGDMQAARRLVEDLPSGLNQAYERIISRIRNDLPETSRTEANRVLSIVTASVLPLSKKEVQMAVSIVGGRDPALGCKTLFLNLLYCCGPIIEEAGGNIQFVHFTAQEYLLGMESGFYLNKAECHRLMASVSLKYLCSTCFDSSHDDDKLIRLILGGAYILQNYIHTYWLHHIIESGASQYAELGSEIHVMLSRRTRRNILEDVTTGKGWKQLSFIPDIWDRTALAAALAFSQRRKRNLCFQENPSAANLDPFTFSDTETRVRSLLESMLCQSRKHEQLCFCGDLKSLYGPQIYKCTRPGCPFYLIGFDTRAKRDNHLNFHSRPFKCDQPSCPYLDIGFSTNSLLIKHFTQYHSLQKPGRSGKIQPSSKKGELKLIMIDLVKEDDVETIMEMHVESRKFAFTLLLTAVRERCSEAMIDHLINLTPQKTASRHIDDRLTARVIKQMYKIFWAAATNSIVEIFDNFNLQMLMSSYKWEVKVVSIIMLAASKRCPDIIEAISRQVPGPHYGDFISRIIPRRPNEEAENTALQCFDRIEAHAMFRTLLVETFYTLSSRCCSAQIASYLLSREPSMSPGQFTRCIQKAARQNFQEAAAFVREMLKWSNGHLDMSSIGWSIQQEIVPRNWETWYGETWADFMQELQGNVEGSEDYTEESEYDTEESLDDVQ